MKYLYETLRFTIIIYTLFSKIKFIVPQLDFFAIEIADVSHCQNNFPILFSLSFRFCFRLFSFLTFVFVFDFFFVSARGFGSTANSTHESGLAKAVVQKLIPQVRSKLLLLTAFASSTVNVRRISSQKSQILITYNI